jgi:hypothetical protein
MKSSQSDSTELSDLGYAERRDVEARNSMISEFNSLAVIFEMPSKIFIEEQRQMVRNDYLLFILFILIHFNSFYDLFFQFFFF